MVPICHKPPQNRAPPRFRPPTSHPRYPRPAHKPPEIDLPASLRPGRSLNYQLDNKRPIVLSSRRCHPARADPRGPNRKEKPR